MSVAAQGNGGGSGRDAHARVTACFELHAGEREDAAAAAAELIHRLQEITSLSQCACDLDVGVEWPSR